MKRLLILLALSFPLSVTAAETEPQSLVSVNGKPINELHFVLYVRQQPQAPKQMDRNTQSALMNELIKTRLLADAAEVTKLDQDAAVKAALDLAHMRVLAEVAIKKHLASHPVTEEQLKAAYNAKYTTESSTEYNASHILLDAEEDATAALKALQEGAEFAAVAKTQSKDVSSEQGGRLGWFGKTQVLKPFADAVANLKAGEYTKQAVKSDYGWHIIKLNEIRTSEAPKYEDVKNDLSLVLQREKLVAYVADLQKNADIKLTPPPKPADDSKAETEKP